MRNTPPFSIVEIYSISSNMNVSGEVKFIHDKYIDNDYHYIYIKFNIAYTPSHN